MTSIQVIHTLADMKVITLLSQKGGAGKTMTAVNIAVAAEQDSISTAVFDLDPQGSASKWRDRRTTVTPAVAPMQASRLPEALAKMKKARAGLVIIDTAPHSESAALAAARVADFVLIPCRPDIFDLEAIITSVDSANLAKKPYSVLLNAVPPRSIDNDHAREALASIEVSVCPIAIIARRSFPRASAEGKSAQEYDPNSKAAAEIAELYKWLKSNVKL